MLKMKTMMMMMIMTMEQILRVTPPTPNLLIGCKPVY